MRAPEINCPYCGTRMLAGSACVTNAMFDFFLFGISRQDLYFRAGKEEEVIINSGQQRAGHRCPDCGTITVYSLAKQWTS